MLQRIQNEQWHFCTHPSFTFMRVWKCNERARPQLSDGRQKKTQFPMPYFRAQWLGQFFSPGIFKGLIFSKQLLDTHIHPLRTRGFTTICRQQKTCATALHAPDLIPPGGSPCSNVTPLTGHYRQLCTLCQHRCWTIFICVYLIPHHLPGGDLKPCIDFYFFNCWRRKLFKNKL